PVGLCLLLVLCAAWQVVASEGASPEGRWSTVDDHTGEVRSIVKIHVDGDELRGDVEQLRRKPGEDPDPVCTRCRGTRRNQRVVGMQILWGNHRQRDRWTGGRVLDPENGKEYASAVWLEGPDRLHVRGYWGPFYRTQTWRRVEDEESAR